MSIREKLARFRRPVYDEAAARDTPELEEILERMAPRPTTSAPPVRIGTMFDSVFMAYAELAARGGSRTVVLGNDAYERARARHLLTWARSKYPNLAIEPASSTVRGPSPTLCIMDEAMDFPSQPERTTS